MRKIKNILSLVIALFVMTAGTYIYSNNINSGVYCKDCGSESNCWAGSGLDSGYQDCQVVYDEDGDAIGCEGLTGYGSECQAYPYPQFN